MEESFRNKKKLIVTSIDFRKAFDSIKRETLVEVLKEYKIHPLVIDSIAKIYVKVKVKVIGFSTDTTHGIRPYVKPGTPNPPTVAPPTAVTAW